MREAPSVTNVDPSREVYKRFGKRGVCVACRRETDLTFHHLIPRKLHRRRYFERHYSKAVLNEGIYVCRLCHDGIHDTYDEMTLAKQFASLDKLLADEALLRHFGWVAKQRVKQ